MQIAWLASAGDILYRLDEQGTIDALDRRTGRELMTPYALPEPPPVNQPISRFITAAPDGRLIMAVSGRTLQALALER